MSAVRAFLEGGEMHGGVNDTGEWPLDTGLCHNEANRENAGCKCTEGGRFALQWRTTMEFRCCSWPHAKLLLPDVNKVLSIPIGKNTEDCWAWVLEKHGIYSVRSAYRSLVYIQ